MSILFDVDLKPDIPNLPFYSLSYKKPGLPDYTRHFFKIITRPIEKVEYIAFLLAGRQGSGKTTFISWTAEKIREHYKPENCNIVGNKYGDLDLLMDHIDARPIQILVCDDAYGNLPKDLNRKFTRIRHVFEEKLKEAGQPLKGVIYAFYAVQDYFQLEPRIRRTVNGTIFKSSVLNPYDKALFKRILEEEGFQKLEEIDFKILYSYDHAARSMNIITLQGLNRPGYIISGVPKDPNVIRWVERKESIQASRSEGSSNAEWPVLRRIEDPSFLELIYECIPNVLDRMKKEGMSTKHFKMHHADAWKKHYVDGVTYDHLAEEYNVSKSIFTNGYKDGGWIAIFSKEILGYAAELALNKRYYPECTWMGFNDQEPDLKGPGNLMVEVKIRKRAEKPILEMLCEKERQNLEEGKPTHLALITYDKKKCAITIYQPTLPNPPPNRR